MLLPTAWCPTCKKDVLTHRTLSEDDPEGGALETRCADCDERLDRFGVAPEGRELDLKELAKAGYSDLDRPAPIGRGGCFETRGCEGCPKIDSRPW